MKMNRVIFRFKNLTATIIDEKKWKQLFENYKFDIIVEGIKVKIYPKLKIYSRKPSEYSLLPFWKSVYEENINTQLKSKIENRIEKLKKLEPIKQICIDFVVEFLGEIIDDTLYFDKERTDDLELFDNILVDDFYDELVITMRGIVLAIALAYPFTMSLFRYGETLSGRKIIDRNFFFSSEILGDLEKEYQLEDAISLSQVFEWISDKSVYLNRENVSLVCLSAVGYALNRNANESLLYSLIGIENLLHLKNTKFKKDKIIERLSLIFPNNSFSDMREIYSARSDLIHNGYLISDYGVEYQYSDSPMTREATKCLKILLDLIRKMIVNNGKEFFFLFNDYKVK